jgi:hypothetical protein
MFHLRSPTPRTTALVTRSYSAICSLNNEMTKSITAASSSIEYVKQCMDMRISNIRYSAEPVVLGAQFNLICTR